MSEIKACPFCGGAKICTEKGININYCDNCSAESNVEQWNTRPIEDALNARIAELEKQIASDDSGSYDSLIPDWAHWIKFYDRLPEEGQSIVAVDKETKKAHCLTYNKSVLSQYGCLLYFDYWLPLPELPEE